MKRIISLSTAVAMLIATAMLTACGANEVSESAQTQSAAEISAESTADASSEETSVSESVDESADATSQSEAVVPGIYYDADAFASTDPVDGGAFYCVILRDNGEALISMQDAATGYWNETDGKASISVQAWEQVFPFEQRGDSIYLSDTDMTYVKADDSIVPEEYAGFYEMGVVPSDLMGMVMMTGGSYVGDYTAVDSTDTFSVSDKGNGYYDIKCTIDQIGSLTGEGNIVDGGMEIGFTLDSNGADCTAVFFLDGENYALQFTSSGIEGITDMTCINYKKN